MKKNLKKAAALALAAIAVSSMTVPTFAKRGDVDDDGVLTANDASLVLQYSRSADDFIQKYSEAFDAAYAEKLVQAVEDKGAVMLSSLRDPDNISSDDALRILAAVTSDKKFYELVQADNAAATGDDKLSDADLTSLIDEKFPVSANVVITYNKTAVRVNADSTADNLYDVLQPALDTATPEIKTKAAGLQNLLSTFTIEGKALSTEEGWNALGDAVLASTSDKTAFAALRPANVDNDYVANFTANVRAAFPAGADTSSLVSALKAKNVAARNVTLYVDGEQVSTDAAEILAYVIENLAYKDGKISEYPKNVTLDFNNGKKAVVKVNEGVRD
jgi:hypothetical protein